MPCCAIISCRSRSNQVSILKGGISFFRFPSDSNLKEKWIVATGRSVDWFPTKTSTICSLHFAEEDFVFSPKRKLLKPTGVPSKNICVIINSISPEIKNTSNNASAYTIGYSPPNVLTHSSVNHTPYNCNTQAIIESKDFIIAQQKSKIKRLQGQNRRLQKKITKIYEVLKNIQQKLLRNENVSNKRRKIKKQVQHNI